MEDLGSMDGVRTWNLWLYTRVPVESLGLSEFRCFGFMMEGREKRRGRRGGGGRKGQNERIPLNIYL